MEIARRGSRTILVRLADSSLVSIRRESVELIAGRTSASDFNVGDRVRVVAPDSGRGLALGDRGVVERVMPVADLLRIGFVSAGARLAPAWHFEIEADNAAPPAAVPAPPEAGSRDTAEAAPTSTILTAPSPPRSGTMDTALDAGTAREIDFLLEHGVKQKLLAQHYRISPPRISAINTGREWAESTCRGAFEDAHTHERVTFVRSLESREQAVRALDELLVKGVGADGSDHANHIAALDLAIWRFDHSDRLAALAEEFGIQL